MCGGADGLIRCARRREVRLSAVALEFLDLGLGSEYLDYQSTWDLQRAIHAEVSGCTRPDTVLLLEHSSVYTAGKRTEPQERPLDGTPVIDVDRGGKITWHGPGQLVGYPIVRLPESVLVVDYVRRLEEAMIAMFAEFGLSTGRIRGRSGVWLAGDAEAARAQDRGYRCPCGGRYDDARLCNQCRSRSSLVRSDHPMWLDRRGHYVHGRRAGHPRDG